MKQRILVSVRDFDRTEDSVIYGVKLARQFAMPATLVSIQRLMYAHVPEFGVPSAAYPEAIADHNLEQVHLDNLRSMHKNLTAEWPDLEYSFEVGFPEMDLINRTKNEEPFLLVIGKRSKPGWWNELFGTRSTHIAEEAFCPVLVVPEGVQFEPVRNILFLTDYKIREDDAAVADYLTDIATRLNAGITVVIVGEKETAEYDPHYLTKMNRLRHLTGQGNVTYHQIFSDDFNKEIDVLHNSVRPAWVAFQERETGFLERLTTSYSTQHIILDAKVPTLVL